MMKAETIFKMLVVQDLKKLNNIWFLKTNEVAVRGIPDFLICLNGRFVAMELKRAQGLEPDGLQEYNLKKIQSRGRGFSFVVNPQNWDEVFGVLQKIDRESLDARIFGKP